MSVCRWCPNRYPACHDTCPDYQAEKAERDGRREQARMGRTNTSEVEFEKTRKAAAERDYKRRRRMKG